MFKHMYEMNKFCIWNCVRCKESFPKLIIKAEEIAGPVDLAVSTEDNYADFVDRYISCISDDEVIIKELLE